MASRQSKRPNEAIQCSGFSIVILHDDSDTHAEKRKVSLRILILPVHRREFCTSSEIKVSSQIYPLLRLL